MYAGKVVESGTLEQVFTRPSHPYTEGLLGCVTDGGADGRPFAAIPGLPMVPINPEGGCRFRPRCSHAFERCRIEQPRPIEVGSGHHAACHLRERVA
jgi:oligopeptide/dipeptide ABC transporter ATP-binding protein